MIECLDALGALAKRRTDEIVVMHMTTRVDWPKVSTNPELDIPWTGAMGKASSFALGLALARPDRKVWVLDGDGALLMNLGGLVTVAVQQPKNLLHVVYNNGAYDTSGGQPVPRARQVDFCAMALAAGYPHAYSFDDLGALERELPAVLGQEGPTLLVLNVPSMGRRPAPTGRGTTQAFWELHDYLAQRPGSA